MAGELSAPAYISHYLQHLGTGFLYRSAAGRFIEKEELRLLSQRSGLASAFLALSAA